MDKLLIENDILSEAIVLEKLDNFMSQASQEENLTARNKLEMLIFEIIYKQLKGMDIMQYKRPISSPKTNIWVRDL